MRFIYANRAGKFLLILILVIGVLQMATACIGTDPGTKEPESMSVEDWVENWRSSKEKAFISAGVDGRRSYSFNINTINTWTNEEGDEILDVLVAIDYADNPGVAVRDEQQWHIDIKNNRYKISDSFAYDIDGRGCES